MAARLPMQMPATRQEPFAAPSYGAAPQQAGGQPQQTALQQQQIQKALLQEQQGHQLTMQENTLQANRLIEEGRREDARNTQRTADKVAQSQIKQLASVGALADFQLEQAERFEPTKLAGLKEEIAGKEQARQASAAQTKLLGLQADVQKTAIRTQDFERDYTTANQLGMSVAVTHATMAHFAKGKATVALEHKVANERKNISRKILQKRMAFTGAKNIALTTLLPPIKQGETKADHVKRTVWNDDEEFRKAFTAYPSDVSVTFWREDIEKKQGAATPSEITEYEDELKRKYTRSSSTAEKQEVWDKMRAIWARRKVDKAHKAWDYKQLSAGTDALIALVRGNQKAGMSEYAATREAMVTRLSGDMAVAAVLSAAMDASRYRALAGGAAGALSPAAFQRLRKELIAEGMPDASMAGVPGVVAFATQKLAEAEKRLRMHASAETFGGDLGAAKVLALLGHGADQLGSRGNSSYPSGNSSYLSAAHTYLSGGFAKVPDPAHGGSPDKDGNVVGTELFKGAHYEMHDETAAGSIVDAEIRISEMRWKQDKTPLQVTVAKLGLDSQKAVVDLRLALRKAHSNGTDWRTDPDVIALNAKLQRLREEGRALMDLHRVSPLPTMPQLPQGAAAAALGAR